LQFVFVLSQFRVSASSLSLPRLNQKINKIKIDFQSETNANLISSKVDEILGAESHSQLTILVDSADLSVDKKTSDKIGKVSNHRVKQLNGYPVVDSGAEEEGPLQYNFPKLKLSGGKRREGRQHHNRVTDDRYYLVVQFKFTFDEKEYHVRF